MEGIEILSIPKVIFKPNISIEIPNIPPYFPCVPSAKYYYVNPNGDKIPMINNVGSESEQVSSLNIWYHMNVNDVFPLLTVYARSRQDQIGRTESNRPGSRIAFSMKSQLKQYEDRDDWFFEDRFQIIIGQMKNQHIEQFINDFYRFPLNPSSDAFMVARLLEEYIRDGDETKLRKYLLDRGIFHLNDHPFGYYPIYQLFFLLTRFASYPLNENQVKLANRRLQTQYGSPERVFIDAIFQYEIYNMDQVFQIIDQITSQGSIAAGAYFGTKNKDWVNWANEYLENYGKPAKGIENLASLNYIIADKLYTWTDIQIETLCNQLQLKTPFHSEYPTRYAYVADIATKIQRFKSDPASAALWKQQVIE
jgi:hypothetical protein